jgi:predicted kinase
MTLLAERSRLERMVNGGDSVTHKGVYGSDDERDHVRKTAQLEDVKLS